MAETSDLSLVGDSPSKPKANRRRAKANKAGAGAAVGEAVKDVQTDMEGAVEGPAGYSTPSVTNEKKKKKTKKSEAASALHDSASIPASAQIGAAATGSAQIENTAVDAVKTSSSKGKGKLMSEKSVSQEHFSEGKLPFLRLSEPLGKIARLAPVFSHDGR